MTWTTQQREGLGSSTFICDLVTVFGVTAARKNGIGRRVKMQELEPRLLNGHFTQTPAARPAAM